MVYKNYKLLLYAINLLNFFSVLIFLCMPQKTNKQTNTQQISLEQNEGE